MNGSGSDSWNDKFGNLVTLPSKSTGTVNGYASRNSGEWVTNAYRVYDDYVGGGKAHNTMQPSKAAYVWLRIS